MFNGAVAAKRNGKLIFKKGYGIPQQTRFDYHCYGDRFSFKQFTSTAILLLQQENKLKVTDFANILVMIFLIKM
jgi:hypothetical protein